MTSLGAMIPGLREIRAPIAGGFLWLVAVGIILHELGQPHMESELVQSAWRGLVYLGTPVIVAVSIFAAYMVGVGAIGLVRSLAEAPLARRLRAWLDRQEGRLGWLQRTVVRPGPEAVTTIRTAIDDLLGPFSTALAEVAPISLVTAEEEKAAFRMSKESPAQFQIFDRARSEGEFRGAVGLPLAFNGLLVIPAMGGPAGLAIGAVVAILGGFLMFLGVLSRHEAEDTLATAIHVGYTSTPILVSLQRELEGVDWEAVEPDGRDAKALVTTLNFLATRNLLSEHRQMFARMRHPSWITRPAVPDLLSKVREQAVPEVLGEIEELERALGRWERVQQRFHEVEASDGD